MSFGRTRGTPSRLTGPARRSAQATCDSCSVTVIPVSPRRGLAERAGLHPLGQPVGDEPRQQLGRGVPAGERRLLVEVAVVQLAQHRAQLGRGRADVDDQVVRVQLGPPERRVDHVRRAVQPLGRSEDLAAEAVRDHDVVADGHAEHRVTLP